ncbi:hypothetical protein [Mycolicibacterium thermoresistibile]
MAVRLLVTTGIALSSAGLLIASLPTVAPPLLDREVRIAAGSQGAGISEVWFPGVPPAAPVDDFASALELVEDVGGPGAPTALLADPDALQTLLDAFFIGYPTSAGPDGFTGLAYFAVDQIFPDSPIVDAFFEGGFTEVARVVLVGLAGGENTPLGGAINDFFEGGVTQLVGNALVDALPDDTYAQGATHAYFFGFSNEDGDEDPPNGIVGATYYTLTTLVSGSPPPIPEEEPEPEPEPEAFTTQDRVAHDREALHRNSLDAVVTAPPADQTRRAEFTVPERSDPEPSAEPPVAEPPVADAAPQPEPEKPRAVDRTERREKPTVDMTTGNKTTVEPMLPFGRRGSGDGSGNWIRDTWKKITGPDTSAAEGSAAENADDGE